MSTETNQSAINEVRDQLSLDYADGQYLNVVGHNLGLNRPVFGFSDDLWRALVKAVALQFKQVRNRFRAVLALLFGPQVTEVGTLAEAVAVGDQSIVVNDASQLPQVGILILDEGQATEEALEYCFIDYSTNEIFFDLESLPAFGHTVTESEDAEEAIIVVNSAGTKIILTNTSDFPTTGFPYTAVVGRGKSTEEIAIITAVDQEEGSVTLLAPLGSVPEVLVPSTIQSTLALPYIAFASFLTLTSSRQFPEEGVVLLDVKTTEFVATAGTVNNVTVAAGTFSANVHAGQFVRFAADTLTVALQDVEAEIDSNTGSIITFSAPLGTAPVAGDRFVIIQPPFNATAGTVNDVTVTPGTFTTDFQVGNRIVFDGNVTAALTGVEVDIVTNTSSVLTFAAALGSAPVSGDTFRIRPRVEYTSNDGTEHVLTLPLPIRDLTLPDGVFVELLQVGATVALAPVKVAGAGWDIFEVSPRELELYIPSSLQDVGDLRSASYIHGSVISPTPSSTLDAAATAGDSFVDLVDSSDFPLVGVILLDPGGVEERIGYYKDPVVADRLVLATQVLTNSFLIGETVDLYQPEHGSTGLLIGDPATVVDTFPGPYVYDVTADAPTGTQALTTLTSLLPGPTRVTIGTIPTRTALEVEDATAFDRVNLPYSIVVGRDTGNRETITVTDINFKQRAETTVATAIVTPDTVNIVEVASLGPGGTDAADFPDASGYRVLLDRGGANEEVVYVVDVIGPDMLVLEDNTARAHGVGETVELLSDVLTVNSLTDTHIGKIPIAQRSSAITGLVPHVARFSSYSSTQVSSAEIVEPTISSLVVVSAVGLDLAGGQVILNPMNGLVQALEALTVDLSAGGTVVTVADSSGYPTTFPYVVTLSPNTPREEKALVTANNTGLGQITLNGGTYGVKFDHDVADGSTILWEPGTQETIEYESVTGTTLSFSPAIVLQSTHSPSEPVIDTSVKSDPRRDGFDFPLRMPVDIRARIEFLWDLIRAAGVRVTIIDTR